MIESDYETCDSDRTPTTDEDEDDDTVRSKRTRRKWKSLSRTYSDVSLNTNKEEFQGKHRSIYSMKETSKENASLSIISEIFDGKIASEIECSTCNRRSKTIETFQNLSPPMSSKEQISKLHSLQSANEEFNFINNDSTFEQNSNQS